MWAVHGAGSKVILKASCSIGGFFAAVRFRDGFGKRLFESVNRSDRGIAVCR